MNTPQPPEDSTRPSWTIIYDHSSPEPPDASRVIHGKPGEWAKYASVQVVDGLGAYVLREEATSLLVFANQDPNRLLMLVAPEPAFFFSFSRFQSAFAGGEPDSWLYSVFGYLLPDTRVYATVLPSHTEYHCEPRSSPFVLLS